MNETHSKTRKVNPNTDKYLRISKILIVEMLGTSILVGGIIFPGAMGFNLDASSHAFGSEGFWNFMNFAFATIIVKSLWVALLIFFLVIFTIRWSANFNPAVSLAEISVGNDSYALGMSKIFVQFIGAFAAVYFTALIIVPAASGLSMEDAWAQGFGLDGTEAIMLHFNYQGFDISDPSTYYVKETFYAAKDAWYWLIQLISETVLTFLLILSVFIGGHKLSKMKRISLITVTVWVILLVGIRFNTIALNPARLIAPAFVSNQFGNSTPMQFVWIFLIGELLAVALFHGLVSKKKAKIIEINNRQKAQYLDELIFEKENRFNK